MFQNEEYYPLSNTELLKKIGKYIKRSRLELNFTQEELAEKTGLERTSISYIENGKGTSLLSLLQVLRSLEKLELLAPLLDDHIPISPIEIVKLQGKQRKYATSKKHADTPKSPSEW